MSALRIDIADLLAHPGARRAVSQAEVLDGLGGVATRVEGPVQIDLTLDRISDGVVARGTVSATWQAECSVCLGDLHRTVEAHVDELFETTPIDGETYPIEGHEIDLEQLVRDNILLDLPIAPRCADPCADLSADASSSSDPDPRWAALSELEL